MVVALEMAVEGTEMVVVVIDEGNLKTIFKLSLQFATIFTFQIKKSLKVLNPKTREKKTNKCVKNGRQAFFFTYIENKTKFDS